MADCLVVGLQQSAVNSALNPTIHPGLRVTTIYFAASPATAKVRAGGVAQAAEAADQIGSGDTPCK